MSESLTRAVGWSWLGTLAALTIGACGYDPNATTELVLPSFDVFAQEVHPFVSRQCGTLDCHGQPGRPLRIYGDMGLRIYDPDARLIPGRDVATTDAELRASFESIIGLEPEATRRVVGGFQDEGTLLVVRKPTGSLPSDTRNFGEGERHKGGRITPTNGAGYRCLTSWLKTPHDTPFSDDGKRACAEARALP